VKQLLILFLLVMGFWHVVPLKDAMHNISMTNADVIQNIERDSSRMTVKNSLFEKYAYVSVYYDSNPYIQYHYDSESFLKYATYREDLSTSGEFGGRGWTVYYQDYLPSVNTYMPYSTFEFRVPVYDTTKYYKLYVDFNGFWRDSSEAGRSYYDSDTDHPIGSGDDRFHTRTYLYSLSLGELDMKYTTLWSNYGMYGISDDFLSSQERYSPFDMALYTTSSDVFYETDARFLFRIGIYCSNVGDDGVISPEYDNLGSNNFGMLMEDFYIRVFYKTSIYSSYALIEDIYYEDVILHVIEFDVPTDELYSKYTFKPTRYVKVDLSSIHSDAINWQLYGYDSGLSYSSRSGDTYYFRMSSFGKHYVIFASYDTWNYDEEELSRVAYFNSRGEFLDFDNFHTYIAESPSRLIRYAPDVNDEDLVAWFRMNEGTGSYTYDWKNNIQGTLYGSPDWVTGYVGQALSFDGSDDYVEVDSDLLDITDEITLEAWIKVYDASTVRKVVNKYDGSDGYGLQVEDVDNDGIPEASFWISESGTVKIVRGEEQFLNKWTHIVGVYDGTKIYVYINGRLSTALSASLSIGIASTTLLIGKRFNNIDYFYGIIDEVRIYKRALSPEEVWWHYSIVFYFDGYRDLLGREPYWVDEEHTEIMQGVFGYAFMRDVQYGSYAIDWLIDYSLTTGCRNGYTVLMFAKNIQQRSGDSWRDVFRLGYHRIEFYYTGNEDWYHIGYEDYGSYGNVMLPTITVPQDDWFFYASEINNDGMFAYVNGEVVKTKSFEFQGLYFSNPPTGSPSWYHLFMVMEHYVTGIVDEVILLREPLSQEMLDNFYYVAKQYIGGYYTDESFQATWDIEQDSPEDGNGFSEDFSDISEWNIGDYLTASTDGDVLNLTAQNTADSTQWTVFWVVFPSPYLDASTYPFFEIRYKYYYEDYPADYFYVDLRTDNNEYLVIFTDSDVGDWELQRYNIYEQLIASGYSTKIASIRLRLRVTVGGINKVLVDWLRVYRIEGGSLGYTADIDGDDWITSIGGTLVFHVNFETSNDEYIVCTYDFPDFDTSSAYFEERFKGYGQIYLRFPDGYALFYLYSDDWSIIRINLETMSYTLSSGEIVLYTKTYSDNSKLEYITIGINDYGSYSSGEYYYYVDYVRIGYPSEKVHDTEWKALLYPLYEHPKSGYIWFNVTDIWGNQMAYEPRAYAPYQDFIFQVYSWKFMNGKDDTFIHIDLNKDGTDIHLSEWLAPREITEYVLTGGSYTLNVSYPSGDWFTVSLSVTKDYFWWLEGDTLGDVLQGIDSVIANITNVNETLYNQIINVNVSLTNWNSDINQTTINIYIDLQNVNSSLHDLIIDNHYLIENMYSTMNNSFINLDVNINNNFTQISGQVVSVNNTVLNVNTTIDWQYNQLTVLILDVNGSILRNVTYQFNGVEDIINKIFNHFRINIYDYYTGMGLELTTFKVYLDGVRVYNPDYYTLLSNVSVVIKDYWDRVLYNATLPANSTADIPIPIGELIIYNDLDIFAYVNVTVEGSNVTLHYAVAPSTAISLRLPFGNYTLIIYTFDYQTKQVYLTTMVTTVGVEMNIPPGGQAPPLEEPPKTEVRIDRDLFEMPKEISLEDPVIGIIVAMGLGVIIMYAVYVYIRKE